MKLLKIGLLGILAAVIAVAGCGGRNKTAAPGTAVSPMAVASRPASARAAAGEFDRAGGGASRPLATPLAVAARKVIKTADLALVARDIDSVEAAVEKVVDQAGGFVLNSEFTGQRRRAQFTLALRVPADRFTAVVDAIAGLGTIERKSIRGEDVTDEYVDLNADLANAQRVQERYFELLAKAQRVSDALEVERELERVGSDIERLKGRLQVIDNQVALSTINLTLRSSARPPLVDFGHGFVQTLRVLLRFLVVVFYIVIFLVGVAIPVILILFLVRFIVRSFKRKPKGG